MSGSVSLTGKDTIIINSRIMNDFADGDVVSIDYPNNLVEVKTGKNGNSIYAYNASGENSTATLRIIRGSADDKFLNGIQAEYRIDPASFPLITSEFIKRAGDGKGGVTSDIAKLSGGVVQKLPAVKENVDGDTEQSITAWQIAFTNAERIIS